MPPPDEIDGRLRAVLHVLYLIFNEGYTATSGARISRTDLTAEAIRLTRALHRVRAGDGEIQGLLALMLLTEARRPARVDAFGELVSLADQDRSRWDRELIAEGVALVTSALACSHRWTGTRGWRGITGCSRCAGICWRWTVRLPPPGPLSRRRPGGQPARPRSGTCCAGRTPAWPTADRYVVPTVGHAGAGPGSRRREARRLG
jgi:hypothetical protein